jgi:low temperature requirement protein LtrA
MLAVIVLAAGSGAVGSGDATVFVLAYVALQMLLAALFFRAWRAAAPAVRPFCARYGIGDALGALLWLLSLAVPEPARYGVWALAMLVLMVTPVVAVRAYAGRAFDPLHIPERYGLFTLIVLGESIVVVAAGTAVTGLALVPALVGVAGFALAACVWWIYFDGVKPIGLRRENLLSSFIWGYGHLLIFAGIAAAAVGVEFGIEAAAHAEPLDLVERVALCGGLLAYLVAISAIHAITVVRWDAVLTRRLLAGLLMAGLGLLGGGLPALVLVALLVLVLLVLLAAEAAQRSA